MQDNAQESLKYGISILIPVFNFDINPLVNQLLNNNTSIDFEIIIIDDCSTTPIDFSNNSTKIRYIKLTQNIGRSKIRNLLASYANYSYLLFLDCDVMPLDENYLRNYEPNLKCNKVIYGGNMYNEIPPENKVYLLHWKAGKFKEQKTVENRRLRPYQSFITYNFVISKGIFLTVLFDEKIIGYGHEDTKFGIELKNNNIPIVHINNPVYHLGLNTNQSFIEKTITGVDNLCKLILNENIGTETNLYKTYFKLKTWRLVFLFKIIYKITKPVIYKNLLGQNPSLIAFDLLKLDRMIHNFSNK